MVGDNGFGFNSNYYDNLKRFAKHYGLRCGSTEPKHIECYNCGSEDIAIVNTKNKDHAYKCRNCGYEHEKDMWSLADPCSAKEVAREDE